VFLQTTLTEHLSTAVDLLWVSGHTQADQTEEVIWRGLHKLMIIAFLVSYTGCHDVATLEHMVYFYACDSHVIIKIKFPVKLTRSRPLLTGHKHEEWFIHVGVNLHNCTCAELAA
jgi:hypothetical protein